MLPRWWRCQVKVDVKNQLEQENDLKGKVKGTRLGSTLTVAVDDVWIQ